MKKKLMGLTMSVVGILVAWAETPTVTDVTAKQRYPWNGLVDIDCTVSGIEGSANGYKFVVVAVDKDSGKEYAAAHFTAKHSGANVPEGGVTENGDYELLWDARADMGQVVIERMAMRVTLEAAGVSAGKVQLWKGGPYWADRNIGADKPEDYGLYFWWGDTTGHRPSGTTFSFSFDSSNCATYGKSISTLQSEGWIVSKDGTNVLAPSHDAAHVKWGGSWRMPTCQELSYLNSKCDWNWMTLNGENGWVVRGRGAYASNSIFLPAAGRSYGTSLYDPGSSGRYWSSVPDSDYYCAYELSINSDIARTYDAGRRYGFSVRPVQGGTN